MAGYNAQPSNTDGFDDTSDSTPQGAAPVDDKQTDEQQTALLPVSLCPGMKPGDEITLRITSVYDGQYEVVYDQKENQEESQEAPDEQTGDTGSYGGGNGEQQMGEMMQ